MNEAQLIPVEHYQAAAQTVRSLTQHSPQIGLILGSGLGPLVEEIEDADVISSADIPHWPRSTVSGHAGRLVIGTLEDRPVLALQGRAHFYEGHSMAAITLPVRVMRLLGIHTLVLTNAAGGLNPSFRAGDIMVIRDQINLPGMAGHNPLLGPNLGQFGPRFPIHTNIYDNALRKLAHRVAEAQDTRLQEGVYVSLSGPSFETPAEVRMLRAWGGDSVGMSTAPEAIVASHAGMRVLGLSTITNMSLDDTEATEEVSHEEVLRLGKTVVPRLAALLRGILREMPPFDFAESENQPEHD